MDKLTDIIMEEVIDAYLEEVENLRQQLEKEVRDANRSFFQVLAVKGLDVSEAPNLGTFSSQWAPLSDAYRRWKLRQGRSGNFYKNTGQLQGALARMGATTVFGAPISEISKFRQHPAVQAGRYRAGTKVRGRSVGGRFAKVAQLPTRLTITPFPAGIDDPESVMRRDLRHKLTNPHGRRLRPLLANFMDWWIETKLRTAVDRALGDRGRVL